MIDFENGTFTLERLHITQINTEDGHHNHTVRFVIEWGSGERFETDEPTGRAILRNLYGECERIMETVAQDAQ